MDAITGAADSLEVRLAGHGGHTSRPHLTQDLTYALATLVTQLPAALSRRLDPRAGASVVWGVVQGFVAFAMVAAVFLVAAWRGLPEDEVRALAFVSLILAIVSLIFVNRSFSASLLTAMRRPNRTLLLVLLGVVAMLALVLFWPVASGLFHFGPPHWQDLSVALAAAVALLAALEGVKRLLQPVL